ncbi:MAG: nucleoside deaminase [Actinobacteria bacterium]|uniref:tRNA-specific adenosine deaminase 2 n=1 Tax=freshwater metagenome TaxID=449393 RepID=A0A6J5ZRX0_9ZZZZ|nr:nucleoside deaminase [Actinomycetota bacterium]MSY70267.1 nucleoside deaminase [Actinomycetota bacterium]MTA76524.1 nucleoside deaminase [Actinomycetota bacterium]
MNDQDLMRKALSVAQQASASGDVPVGAVIVNSAGEIVATGHNERELNNDPTAHAEIVAIRKAALSLGEWRLENHTIVVTLEPCPMCAGAIAQSRISTLVFGAWDEKAGAVGSVWDLIRDPRALNKVEVRGGVLADECSSVLKEFIQGVRKKD